MGIEGDQQLDGDLGWHAALAALDWQVELGLVDVIGEAPVDRFGLAEAAVPQAAPRTQVAAPDPVAPPQRADPVAALAQAVEVAEVAARGAGNLEALREAMAAYPHCELRRGARNLVFADGLPGARVLILGEAPGREEDLEGRPFVGAAGQLLDRMFAAIGLSRQSPDPKTALYITNVLPWRPPGNRDPEAEEVAMMRPFVLRHIALAAPEVIVVMGNTPLFALTGGRGIMKARGHWTEVAGLPVLPMTHPAYLLRNPAAKREAWADLLALQARLGGKA
jgi:uracil-DNA glycosylase family 4